MMNFNPHSPCGERPLLERRTIGQDGFQSTLPMRGATLTVVDHQQSAPISIHTPHAGSDWDALPAWMREAIISIHTPHAGSDFPVTVEL